MTVATTSNTRQDVPAAAAADSQSGEQDALDRPLTTATTGDITAAENQTLVDARNTADSAVEATFGNLEITDASIIHDSPTPEQSPWTVMVDLTTNMNEEVGAEAKLHSLLQLAQSTVGSDMTLVVQSVNTPVDAGAAEEAGSQSGDDASLMLEQYVVRDGQIYQIYDGQSEGMQEDLTRLMDAAAQYAPSEHLGLVIQGHGLPTGMIGDSGRMSTEEIAQTIATGLEQAGAGQLDFIDLDACLMGNTAVVDALSGVAGQVVASPEVETAEPGADGQNLAAALRRGIEDPALSTQEMVQYFSAVARAGLNGTVHTEEDGDVSATPTLTQYDTSHANDLQAAMNALGEGLAPLMDDPATREAVGRVIDAAEIIYGPHGSNSTGTQNRDLGQFLTALQTAISGGEIRDADGHLGRLTAAAQTALDDLVVDYTAVDADYQDNSGMTVYLPDLHWVSGASVADTNIDTTMKFLKGMREASLHPEGPLDGFIANLGKFARGNERNMQRFAADADPADAQRFLDALHDLQTADAGNVTERIEATGQAYQNFLDSPSGAAYLQNWQRQLSEQQIPLVVDQHIPESYAGWQSFIESLIS